MLVQQVDAFKPAWLKDEAGAARLDKFLQMAERETRVMGALARARRLTHQNSLKAETAATRVAACPDGARPWARNSQQQFSAQGPWSISFKASLHNAAPIRFEHNRSKISFSARSVIWLGL